MTSSTTPEQFDDPVFGCVTFNPNRLSFESLWQVKAFQPYLEPFDLEDIDPRYHDWIENWKDSIPKLLKVCRKSEVLYALRYQRVCELSVGRRTEDTSIFEDQRDVFSHFLENEDDYTRKTLQSLVDYYHKLDEFDREQVMDCLTQSDRDWFVEGVDVRNVERMCPLDRIEISPHGATTPPSLAFTFQAAWDYEHGFGVVWRDGNIVGLGCADEVAELMGYEDEY